MVHRRKSWFMKVLRGIIIQEWRMKIKLTLRSVKIMWNKKKTLGGHLNTKIIIISCLIMNIKQK
jgi:hypothetical protein